MHDKIAVLLTLLHLNTPDKLVEKPKQKIDPQYITVEEFCDPVTITVGTFLGWDVVVNLGIPAIIGGVVWLGKCISGNNRPTNKEIAIGTICGGVANKYYADKSPGKPGANDGFVPPKRGDGRKVKHEDSGQYGWVDQDGKIWIPTGPKGHGGPHWDVEYPDGTSYDNVFPGGKVRPGRR